jgi:hypothetical protein
MEFRRQQEGRTRTEFFYIGHIQNSKKWKTLSDERASNILSIFGHCPSFHEAQN